MDIHSVGTQQDSYAGFGQSRKLIGLNPIPGTNRISFSGEPDYGQLEMMENNPDPLFPPLNKSDPKFKWAYKKLLAFSVKPGGEIMDDDGLSHAIDKKKDYVHYVNYLNGLFKRDDWRQIYNLANSVIKVYGFPETDITYDPRNPTGGSKDNIIVSSGDIDPPNTGNESIPANALVMWSCPPIDKNGVVQVPLGVQRIANFPENLMPLMTVPYKPKIHRASAKLMREATEEASDVIDFQDAREIGEKSQNIFTVLKTMAGLLAAYVDEKEGQDALDTYNKYMDIDNSQIRELFLNPGDNMIGDEPQEITKSDIKQKMSNLNSKAGNSKDMQIAQLVSMDILAENAGSMGDVFRKKIIGRNGGKRVPPGSEMYLIASTTGQSSM